MGEVLIPALTPLSFRNTDKARAPRWSREVCSSDLSQYDGIPKRHARVLAREDRAVWETLKGEGDGSGGKWSGPYSGEQEQRKDPHDVGLLKCAEKIRRLSIPRIIPL